ncbi:Alpha/beta hydrolase family protein [Caballeronia arationis]|uniref:esterase/lipase family protein n=1 Tax=Caballeronia arationis TaxID=1777142 RepID=UPI00074B3D87|nr:alpha/beta fold hydrolase [Caballeronia arationis]SAL07682.1 Alpha/beta hydrolase family protein [Caballeronia arationis]
MSIEYSDVIRAGAELIHPDTGKWFLVADARDPVVVFVHGFTAHGRYLSRLAEYVGAHGFTPALFNYDSYRGIDQAARDLEMLLVELDDTIRDDGIFLVGHSMGGLVARYLVQYRAERSGIRVRGIASLGTPHGGTLSKRHVGHLLDWADSVTLPNPFSRVPACPSSMQLTDASSTGLISKLNHDAASDARCIPMLSISGGLPFLEFGTGGNGGFAGMLRNLVLQRLIGEQPNDGLVAESSADIVKVVSARPQQAHLRDYPGYDRVNHSYLGRNQHVAGIVVRWLKETLRATVPPAQ